MKFQNDIEFFMNKMIKRESRLYSPGMQMVKCL